MARPPNANAEQTKHKILMAASELFAHHGYEGASVRQIATGAGVSLGMIRHYFGSKEGLYRACIGTAFEVFSHLGLQIAQGVAAGGDPKQVVAAAVRHGFQFACENRSACKLMLWDMMQRERWRSEFTDSQMVPYIMGTARAVAAPLQRTVPDMALITRTMIFVIVRYATADHDEAAYLLSDGAVDRAGPDTARAIEDHLVDVALRLYT